MDSAQASLENNNNSVESVIPDNSREEDRKKLVETAVKFLQNDRVQQTPLDQKRAFLSRKGLSPAEVETALNLAGVRPNSDGSAGISADSRQMAASSNVYQPAPMQQQGAAWRDYASAAVLVGGGSYALYKLAREYVLPKWFGWPSPEQERFKRLEENVSELHTSVRFLCDSIQQTLGILQSQQTVLTRVDTHLAAGGGVGESSSGSPSESTSSSNSITANTITELKNDLSIVKGLLLNRNQFAPMPGPVIGGSGGFPNLPSWQLKPKAEGLLGITELKNELPNGDDHVTTTSETKMTTSEAGENQFVHEPNGEGDHNNNGLSVMTNGSNGINGDVSPLLNSNGVKNGGHHNFDDESVSPVKTVSSTTTSSTKSSKNRKTAKKKADLEVAD